MYRLKIGLLIAAVLAIVSALSGAPAEEPAAPVLVPAHVVRVVDGDTIVCDVDCDEIKVRLIGIDTPETVHPEKEVEYFGAEASAYAADMLDGQDVYLEYDVERTDRYGRDLAYVWLEDGTLFNELLVLEGYATVATYPPKAAMADDNGVVTGINPLRARRPAFVVAFPALGKAFDEKTTRRAETLPRLLWNDSQILKYAAGLDALGQFRQVSEILPWVVWMRKQLVNGDHLQHLVHGREPPFASGIP